jgi:ParB-like nuclease domain
MSRTLQARAPSAGTSTSGTSSTSGRTGRGTSGSSIAGDTLLNQPGTFMMIPVTDLKVDTEYQRPLNGGRVDRISSAWSWIACGCLLVALRGTGSGDYYVVDGQHRMASAERAGITKLPCLVFETSAHQEEAQGFLDANTNRKAMSVLDRYRALLVVQDPTALVLQKLLRQADREPSLHPRPDSVKCLDFLLYAIRTDQDVLERLWPLIVDLCDGRPILKRLVQGVFYVERFLSNTSLLERHWRRRLMTIGYDGLTKSIDETCAYEGKAGGAVCAQGILRAVNKGLRNKLTIQMGKDHIDQGGDE